MLVSVVSTIEQYNMGEGQIQECMFLYGVIKEALLEDKSLSQLMTNMKRNMMWWEFGQAQRSFDYCKHIDVFKA